MCASARFCDPLSHTTTFTYEASGARNLQSITDPLGHQTSFTYDGQGRPLTITTPAGTTQLGYTLGDLTTVTDPLGASTTRFSDPAGRLISVTSPLGRRTRYQWDPLNQLTSLIDPLGGTTQLTYDANGNLTGVRDAKGNLTQYAPDSMDRVLTRTDALSHQSQVLLYDPNGNPQQVRDRKGQVTTTTYDPLNRPTLVTWADGSTTTLTWDLGNRLTQIVDSISGTITRQWDDLDRLQYEQTPQGRVDYAYDAAGRRQTMTVLGQPGVTYAWDTADRLQSLTQGAATVGFGYDDANRRTSVTFPNGIQAAYGYNARDLTGITFTLGGNTLGTLTYTTDADGRRTLVGGTWARTTLPAAITSATYNANNQQTAVGATTLSYDLNGNLTADGATTYSWDARDRLIATNAGTSTFQYDPLGRRTQKVISGATTRFHYDGDNPIQELDAAGTILATLLTGLGIDELFTRTDSIGTRTLLDDALGSVLALADDAGILQTTYTYEPFGTATAGGQTSTNPYQFTSRENDGTGLDYYRARYYSPSRQRFISEDPIGFQAGDPNLYAYALNDPLKWVDPAGESVTVIWLKGQGGNPAGHIAVSIDGQQIVGFENAPGFDLRASLDVSVPGVVVPLGGGPNRVVLDSVTIYTSPSQDIKMLAFIAARKANPGEYKLTGRNCAQFGRDVLTAAGIEISKSVTPKYFMRDIRSQCFGDNRTLSCIGRSP